MWKKLRLWWLKRKLQKAVDQNLLAYDAQSEPGIVNHRLICLMDGVAFHNYKKHLIRFYVPSQTKVECVSLLKTYRIKTEPKINNYLRDMGASTASGDKNFILGVGRGVVLLGSF